MTRWLSRRHPAYVRSIVYMLQASEYDVRHFFAWHERVRDFRRVERRRHLDFTPQATVLFVSGWAGALGALFTAFVVAQGGSAWEYAAAILLVAELPLAALAAVLLALLCLRVIRLPVEAYIISRAQRVLRAHKAEKIAVAGSYGKTSMREILRTILAEGKKVAAPPGSYNTPLGISKFVRTLTGDEDVIVFEFGEYYPGDIRKLCEFVEPQRGVITGVNEAHLEKFGTLEKTAATVFELAEWLGSGPLCVNGENRIAVAHAPESAVLYSRAGCDEWKVTDAKTSLKGTQFVLTKGGERLQGESMLLGLHMLGPLVCAVHVADRLGLSMQQIQRGIQNTKPFEHRLEPKQWEGGVAFLDDSYNGNPDGAAAVVSFLASLKGRRWYITPGLVEAGSRVKEVHRVIGRQLAQAGIEKVVLIQNSVTPYIQDGLREADFRGDLLWYDDMPEALEAVRQSTVGGDVVLVQNDWPDQYA